MTGICTVCTLNLKCLYFIERAKWDIFISDSLFLSLCLLHLCAGSRRQMASEKLTLEKWHVCCFPDESPFLKLVEQCLSQVSCGACGLGDRWVPHAAKFSTPGKPFEDCFTIMGLWRCVINWPAMNGFTGVSRHAHHYCYLTGKSNC